MSSSSGDEVERWLRKKHDVFVRDVAEILDLDAGLCEIVGDCPREIAPSVRRLLAEFNEGTPEKLRIAPADSQPKVHLSDGTLCEVDADGWVYSPGDLDAPRGIDMQPISIIDSPES